MGLSMTELRESLTNFFVANAASFSRRLQKRTRPMVGFWEHIERP
jgi:hypothetical protein